jgi:hypothetical protein
MYYPSWKVKVDGVGAPPLMVDGALRGVVVPAGTHQVTWYYDARLVWLGVAVSIASGLAIGASIVWRARSGRPASE